MLFAVNSLNFCIPQIIKFFIRANEYLYTLVLSAGFEPSIFALKGRGPYLLVDESIYGAPRGIRTPTNLRSADFKSAVSTIPPPAHIKLFELAAALGVEPRPEDLESSALPLRHTASFSILRERFFYYRSLNFLYILYHNFFKKSTFISHWVKHWSIFLNMIMRYNAD